MRRTMFIFLMALSTAAYADTASISTNDFVDKVAVANKFEIDTSELALKYGNAPDVKSFAQQMIDDHTKAAGEFKKSLAEAKIVPTKDTDISHTAKYAKLRVFTTNAGFDSAYVEAQLEAHRDAVALFKDYATNGTTPEVKTFAEKMLPTLEHHLTMVQELQTKLPKS